MSWWHRWQESDSVKYSLGIFCPPSTCAELGKNAPLDPSPSSAISAGGSLGFSMRALFCQRDSRRYQAPAQIPATTIKTIATRAIAPPNLGDDHPRPPTHSANKMAAPIS